MEKDVSKQTIVVLVFLVILVSVLGTFTVLQEVGNKDFSASKATTISSENKNTGEIKLYIDNSEPLVTSSSGEITLEVVN